MHAFADVSSGTNMCPSLTTNCTSSETMPSRPFFAPSSLNPEFFDLDPQDNMLSRRSETPSTPSIGCALASNNQTLRRSERSRGRYSSQALPTIERIMGPDAANLDMAIAHSLPWSGGDRVSPGSESETSKRMFFSEHRPCVVQSPRSKTLKWARNSSGKPRRSDSSSERSQSSDANFFDQLEEEDEDTMFACMKKGSLHFHTRSSVREKLQLPRFSPKRESFNDDALGLSSRENSLKAEILWKFTYGTEDLQVPTERKMTPEEYEDRMKVYEGIYTQDMIRKTCDVPENERTTVMLRNLPNKYSKENVLDLLHTYEYGEHFDFFYLPVDFRSKSNMGYCFINFVNPEDAKQFKKVFAGFSDWKLNSTKQCQVDWSQPYQGLPAHVERYRNSPVMHESISKEFQPTLYRNGEPMPFPKAQSEIDKPKVRRSKRTTKHKNKA